MVQFNDSTQFFATYEQLSTSVPASILWYSSCDYDQFREDATQETTSRGDDGGVARSRHIFIQDLLHRQSEQRQLGISDPRGLLVLSRACSKAAKVRARRNALEVARDVGSSAPGLEKAQSTPSSSLFLRRRELAKKTICASTA
mmetsp:Transcript_130754/g.194844  ORF Transcript_130754/g.194844 Transcript_130754/m.194844 type:complete len:144 (+) Transcript_130754:25-456(+)|eukprot:CAMPEP_0117063782 /NCGR_PEP_ID=MMETSP0472-20121206/44526_1 /TAXON_ID=693140 ORGANISM="Tiarina fusus, Strain LIS" /NCGR_SAMPLE_ID=MMETSP0472 /ASSEMBLY_ACC=CAM_ASM_000603 /LENGTH=143 /DNA_ID=CAMNT_0004783623 /DNA_START=23 /DNA_END=454 /DNA_ORIENTATION=-